MAPWVDLQLATGEGGEASPYASDAELVNLQLVPQPPGSRVPFIIQATPAFYAITTSGTGSMRGVAMFDGYLFYVRGTEIYRGTSAGSTSAWTLVGTIAGTARCRMVDAVTHLVVVDGTNAYACTTSAVTACSRGNFSDVTYQDGITFFTETGTNSVYASDVDDPTTIDALSFTTADALGGDCVGLISDHREVVVFKEGSTEFYYNSGGSGFPLTRSSPGIAERGCARNATICKYDNSIYFLGDDYRVYRMSGYQPVRVSTPWVEQLLSVGFIGLVSSIGATLYKVAGRTFYALTIPATIAADVGYYRVVLDIDSGLWFRHEPLAESDFGAVGAGTGQVGTNKVEVGGAMLTATTAMPRAISALSTGLRELKPSTWTDDGATANPRAMTLPVVGNGAGRMFMPELYLDQAKESGASTVDLRWCDDTSGNYTALAAHTGVATNLRTRWQRLGSFYHRTLRFLFSTNTRVTIVGVRARLEKGGA